MGISEIAPPGMAPPAARYAHATLSSDTSRTLRTSGVVPIAPDGTVPGDIGEQARAVWRNLGLLLAEAEMSFVDVASIVTYVVAGPALADDLAAVMAVRDEVFAGHRAASTLVTVPALARPEWRVEISLVACR
ncbi:MAG: hypothetical protein RL330_1240 [Actinomycetota bacterium]|jgi:2-iminobutanoate/2-iminopropanoate deaminase